MTSKVVSKAEGAVVADGDREDAIDAETVRWWPARGRPGSSRPVTASCWPRPASTPATPRPGRSCCCPWTRTPGPPAARGLRERLRRQVAVVVSDTLGRPWRLGLTDVAVGVAGLAPLRRPPRAHGRLRQQAGADRGGGRRRGGRGGRAGQGQARGRPGRRRPRARPVVGRRGRAGSRARWCARRTRTCSGSATARSSPARRTVRTFADRPCDRDEVAGRRGRRGDRAGAAPHDAMAVRPRRDAARRTRLLDAMASGGPPTCAPTASTTPRWSAGCAAATCCARAPYLVVPCLVTEARTTTRTRAAAGAEREMFLVAMGAGVENLLGRAGRRGTGLGLGVEHAVLPGRRAAALDLPAGWEPMGAVAVGHPAGAPPDRPPRNPATYTSCADRASRSASGRGGRAGRTADRGGAGRPRTARSSARPGSGARHTARAARASRRRPRLSGRSARRRPARRGGSRRPTRRRGRRARAGGPRRTSTPRSPAATAAAGRPPPRSTVRVRSSAADRSVAADDRAGPVRADAGTVPGPRGHPAPALRRRHHPQAGRCRTGSGLAVRDESRRHDRRASCPVTFCSSTLGTSASGTRLVRGTRQPRCRRHTSRSNGCCGSKASAPQSPAPSRSGSESTSQAAPGPHATHLDRSPPTIRSRCVAGPSGVSAVRHSPAASIRRVGSPPPRRSGPSVTRGRRGDPGARCGRSASAAGPSSLDVRTERSGSATPTQMRAPAASSQSAPDHRAVAEHGVLHHGAFADPAPDPTTDATTRASAQTTAAVLQHRAVHDRTGGDGRPGAHDAAAVDQRGRIDHSRPAAAATAPPARERPTTAPRRARGRASRGTNAAGVPRSSQYESSTQPRTDAPPSSRPGNVSRSTETTRPRGDRVDDGAAEHVAAGVHLVGDRVGHLLQEPRHAAGGVGRHAPERPRVRDRDQVQRHVGVGLPVPAHLPGEVVPGQDVAVEHDDWVVRADCAAGRHVADRAAGAQRLVLGDELELAARTPRRRRGSPRRPRRGRTSPARRGRCRRRAAGRAGAARTGRPRPAASAWACRR